MKDRGNITSSPETGDSIREKMVAAYSGEPTDEIPVSIYRRMLPRGNVERRLRNKGLGILDYYPVASMLAPPWLLKEGYHSRVEGANFTIKYIDEPGGRASVRTYETPLGSVSQKVVTVGENDSPRIREHYIQSEDDYEPLKYIINNTLIRDQSEQFINRRDDLGGDGLVLGRVDRSPYQMILNELAGAQRFFHDLHNNPDPVIELMEAIEIKLDEQFELAVASDAEFIWQPDNVSADTVPPRYFEEFLYPYYNKRAEQLKDAGKTYVIHMDGKLKPLKEMIRDLEFDVIESFSLPEVSGDMTYPEAKSYFPGKVIAPNFPSSLIRPGMEAKREDFLDDLLDQVEEDDPFIFQFSEDFDPSNWQEILPKVCDQITAFNR